MTQPCKSYEKTTRLLTIQTSDFTNEPLPPTDSKLMAPPLLPDDDDDDDEDDDDKGSALSATDSK